MLDSTPVPSLQKGKCPLHLLGRKTLEFKGFTKITLLHVNTKELLLLSRRNPAARVTFSRCSYPAAQPESLARSVGYDREDPRPQGRARSGRGDGVRKAPRESRARAAPGAAVERSPSTKLRGAFPATAPLSGRRGRPGLGPTQCTRA